mmetsp:Transcript_4301/g.10255  ORF Transcript_4301/g.10255 Transcript_4301/m.10255 type:complete len:208 (-) Transcript_4301:922-1545(-)
MVSPAWHSSNSRSPTPPWATRPTTTLRRSSSPPSSRGCTAARTPPSGASCPGPANPAPSNTITRQHTRTSPGHRPRRRCTGTSPAPTRSWCRMPDSSPALPTGPTPSACATPPTAAAAAPTPPSSTGRSLPPPPSAGASATSWRSRSGSARCARGQSCPTDRRSTPVAPSRRRRLASRPSSRCSVLRSWRDTLTRWCTIPWRDSPRC